MRVENGGKWENMERSHQQGGDADADRELPFKGHAAARKKDLTIHNHLVMVSACKL
jgi:hypothetical protein